MSLVRGTIMDDVQEAVPIPVGSVQWYQEVVGRALQYPLLRDFQVELSMELAKGKDVVFIGACGIGKSALFYVPLMAARLRYGQALAILVVPTKALSEDQAKAANQRGLRAIAVNSDSLRESSCVTPRRKLFDEVADGLWELVIVSPEMLKHPELNKKMQAKAFRSRICFFGVDEFHLIQEHGEDFRSAYQDIGLWRSRLPPETRWIITTATPPTGPALQAVLNSLRFKEPEYIIQKLPVDRPNVKYTTRFLQHSISGNTMFDIAWVIPMSAKRPEDIPKTIIFCQTIEFGYRVIKFLEALLPIDFPDRANIIMPFHSLLSSDYRSNCMSDLRNGKHRVMVVLEAFTYGVDVSDVMILITLGLVKTLSQMLQILGRCVRNGKQGYAYTYAPAWVRDIPEAERRNTKQEAIDLKRREGMSQILRAWHNPSEDRCPRFTICKHYDEDFSPPEQCCNVHQPDEAHDLEVKHRIAAIMQDPEASQSLRSDGTHHTLDKSVMFPAAQRIIDAWAMRRWSAIRGAKTYLPSTYFFPEFLRERLCKKLHIITSFAALEKVIPEWRALKEHGPALYRHCAELLKSFDEWWDELKEEESKGPEDHNNLVQDTDIPAAKASAAGSKHSIRIVLKPQIPADQPQPVENKRKTSSKSDPESTTTAAAKKPRIQDVKGKENELPGRLRAASTGGGRKTRSTKQSK